jgi:PAS domain S-box-containing protein
LHPPGKFKLGVEISFLGRNFSITSDREQILTLLLSTFEDVVRAHRQLQASQAELTSAHAKIEEYARLLEGRVRTSEEKYGTMMDHAIDAVIVSDERGKVQEVNHQAEALLARPAAEILGRDVLDFVVTSQADLAARVRERFGAEGKLRTDELVFEQPQGRKLSVDASMSVAEVAGRKLRLAILRDVTDRKELERQLQQAQKMEAVGRLASGIAHDFNNLLSVILGYGSLVLGRLAADNAVRGKVQEIIRAGERVASLTRQLLMFSRKQVLEPRVLDLNRVVADLENMIRRLIGEDIDMKVALAKDLGCVRADPGQIEQVLMNLAVNACDAMPSGGKLTIETDDAVLDETYASQHAEVRPGRYVLLAVTDTGIGMEPETRSHIFEPFFTTKGPEKGTGLGLATVYGIVKQSEGHIAVYSEPDHGATFKVYLPRVDAPVAAGEAVRGESPPLRGSETILLAEDQETLREVARDVLEELGYRVLTAASGEAALETVDRHPGPPYTCC